MGPTCRMESATSTRHSGRPCTEGASAILHIESSVEEFELALTAVVEGMLSPRRKIDARLVVAPITDSGTSRNGAALICETMNVCPGAPDEEHPEHTHDFRLAHVVLDGEMTLTVEGVPHLLKPGDRMDVPAGTVHSLKLGPQGCTHLAAM